MAKMVHDLALRPSTSTVQAPHWLVSQPTCVPVRLSCSRRKCTRSRRGSTCALRTLPLTVIETCVIGSSLSACLSGFHGQLNTRRLSWASGFCQAPNSKSARRHRVTPAQREVSIGSYRCRQRHPLCLRKLRRVRNKIGPRMNVRGPVGVTRRLARYFQPPDLRVNRAESARLLSGAGSGSPDARLISRSRLSSSGKPAS